MQDEDGNRYDFEVKADKKTACGKKGIPHRMRRWNCYETTCINKGCKYKI